MRALKFRVHINGHNLEISQYTGLKDKNGKRIYEGDIMQQWQSLWIIKWGDESDYCGFIAERIGDEVHELFINHNWVKSKVIGNIYENKELLKNGKTKKDS